MTDRPTPSLSPIEGMRLRLRLAERGDAVYIHGLRSDPQYNRYLSPAGGTVADQENWLTRYKIREADGAEYYYVTERRADNLPCGLVRLYDLTEESFTWGSFILDHNKPAKAALESAVLSFGVGFDVLGLKTALIDVRNDNTKARTFYERFGMDFLRRDAQDTYFQYTADQYHRDKPGHLQALGAG